jgi:hypothetical protein
LDAKYYNSLVSIWEPVIEQASFYIEIIQKVNEKLGKKINNIRIKQSESCQEISVTISTQFIKVISKALELFNMAVEQSSIKNSLKTNSLDLLNLNLESS